MSQHSSRGSIALTGATLITNTVGKSSDSAVLIEKGIITAMGTDTKIRALAEAAAIPVRDVRGATVTPGLFDSHIHPHWAAEVTAGIDLSGLGTIEELQEAIRLEADQLPEGAWVRGWNLEYEPFHDRGMHGDFFDDVTGGRPMALICYDLHTGLANAEALRRAGISGSREFSDASEIVIDDYGVPTGELREPSAYQLVFNAVPRRSHDEERDALRDMFRTLAKVGLTGGAIMDGNVRTVDLIEELELRGELDQRYIVHHWHAVGDDNAEVAAVIASKGRRGNLWETGAVKLFSDGVIDTGTAWLHAPDTLGDGRLPFWPDWNRYIEVIQAYHAAGMLIATHAVGDLAVGRVLEAYAALPERPGLPFHSIEHLEVLTDEEIEAIRGSNVTASMQPLHMQWRAEDGSDNWAQRLADRAASGYRVRDVLDTGTPVVLGSDWPVAQYDPRIGLSWARGRHTPGQPGAKAFEPSQQLSGEEALLAYTLWPAQARGYDNRGIIAVGAVGDLTLWGDDPVAATPDELIDIPIVLTIVDGRIVHDLYAQHE